VLKQGSQRVAENKPKKYKVTKRTMNKIKSAGITFHQDGNFYIDCFLIDCRTPKWHKIMEILMASELSKGYFILSITHSAVYPGPDYPQWMQELISAIKKIEGFDEYCWDHNRGPGDIGTFRNAGKSLPLVNNTLQDPPVECPLPEPSHRGL